MEPDNICFEIKDYETYQHLGLNGCGDLSGYAFMISYQIFVGVILFNLFVAIVL